jgi:predicted transcriptional regulator
MLAGYANCLNMPATDKCPKCKGTGRVPNQKSVGEEMRQLREKHGKSLRQIAKILGFSAPYISDLEHGRRDWNPATMLNYTNACKQ